jgi:uracil-DNA glycosylase family 4
MHDIIYHSGSMPSDLMIVGEKPGRIESNTGYPFSGASGEILSTILAHCGSNPPYHKGGIYITNLDKQYVEGNPDPTYEDILKWGEALRKEVIACKPKVIMCAGRYSSWWFLGGWGKWGMRTIHGRVCRGGELVNWDYLADYPEVIGNEHVALDGEACEEFAQRVELDYRNRSNGALIVPCFHPANALPSRDPKGDMMGVVWRDFDTAIRAYEKVAHLTHNKASAYRNESELELFGVQLPIDRVGKELYIDATGVDIVEYINDVSSLDRIIAIDTEDTEDPTIPWTIQICSTPGYALTLRIDQPDAQLGIDAIQQAMNDYLIIMHFAIHDLPVLRKLNINTSRINLVDTSYMLYLLAEPQSLKVAAWRHCSMLMQEYNDVIGDVATVAQIKYLLDVVVRQYPSPGKLQYIANNGQLKSYSPHSPSTKAKGIVKSINEGKEVDIWHRWHNVSASGHKARIIKDLYQPVVDELGRMPRGCLKDVERDKAIIYECRDACATLRVYLALIVKLQQLGLA